MTTKATHIKDSFLKLSKTEQLELMHYFLQVVSNDAADASFELSAEWKTELDKRDEAYKNGSSKAIPLKDALSQFGV